METIVKSKRRRVQKRLQRAVLGGRVTLDAIAKVTARHPRSVSEWVSGIRLPPSAALPHIEAALK